MHSPSQPSRLHYPSSTSRLVQTTKYSQTSSKFKGCLQQQKMGVKCRGNDALWSFLPHLLIYDLFNDAVSCLVCIASVRKLINNGIWNSRSLLKGIIPTFPCKVWRKPWKLRQDDQSLERNLNSERPERPERDARVLIITQPRLPVLPEFSQISSIMKQDSGRVTTQTDCRFNCSISAAPPNWNLNK